MTWTKQYKMKIALMIALLLSALFDTITFLVGNLHQFEVNPIYLLTSSVLVLLLVKFAAIALIIWCLFKVKPSKTHVYAFGIVLIIVYLFVMQCVGGFSNLQVKQEYELTVGTPQEIQPMAAEQAGKVYLVMMLVNVYLPLFLALASFWIFERIWLREVKQNDK